MSDIKIKSKLKIHNPHVILILSVIAGIFIFVVLLCISAFIITKVAIKKEFLFLFIIASSGISSLLSSFAASNKISKNKLFAGLISALTITVIQFLIILCLNNNNLALKTYFIIPTDIILGFLGSIAGINILRK